MPDAKYAEDWQQVYEHKERPLMDLFLGKPGELFVDVGAHAGRWVLPFAHLFAHVIAFEPNPDAWRALVDNLWKNGSRNVSPHNMGIAEESGWKTLSELDGVPSRSTLYPEYSGLPVTRKLTALFIRLDALLDMGKVDFLKVDTEGSELSVLRSGREVLSKWEPRLCVETHSDSLRGACSDFLRSIRFPFEEFTLPEDAPASRHSAKGEKHTYIVRV